MKKPERVEVGQWWLIHGMPHRIDAVDQDSDKFTTMHGPVTHGSDGVCVNAHAMWTSVVMDVYEYLGSGEHPEPSEWMIETLAEHVNAIVDRAAEPTGHARTLARHIVGGGHTRWNDIREGVLLERAVLSLYSILRKLGKW